MKAIVAVDETWAIGKAGGLLCHIPGDLKNFKRITTGHTVIMGRKTLESLPGGQPLPGRKNIVLSKQAVPTEGITLVNSMGALFNELVQTEDMEGAFIIGGGQVYQQFIPYCQEIYVTKIHQAFSGTDTFFPNLDELDIWQLAEESETMEENGIEYHFAVYRRK